MTKPTGVGQSAQLLVEVIKKLDKQHLNYCVIGALAAALHGVVRASLDADLVIFSDNKIFPPQEILKLVSDSSYQVDLRIGDLFDPIVSVIQIHDQFGNRVDILMGVRGIFPDCLERVVKNMLFGSELAFIGLEDFITSKISAGGPRDLDDIREVIAISKDQLDQKLLFSLVARLGDEELEVLKRMLL